MDIQLINNHIKEIKQLVNFIINPDVVTNENKTYFETISATSDENKTPKNTIPNELSHVSVSIMNA